MKLFSIFAPYLGLLLVLGHPGLVLCATSKMIREDTTDVRTLQSKGGQSQHVWEDISYDDFESGWGNFEPFANPSDQRGAIRVRNNGNTFGTKQQQWIPEGMAALRIRGTNSSVMLRDPYDMTECDALMVVFSWIARSMENGESFLLEYSSNTGTTWNQAKTFIKGSGGTSGGYAFGDNDLKYAYTVIMNEPDYDLNTTEAKIRFRCNAGDGDLGNRDFIYIDNVRLSCGKLI